MRKIKLQAAAALLLALSPAPLLISCAADDEPRVELTLIHGWGGAESEQEAVRNIYAAFQEKRPDVRLTMMPMADSGGVVRKAGDMLMTGAVPDILFLGGDWGALPLYEFMIENDLAMDIASYAESRPELAASISDANKRYWTREDGSLYTVSDVLLLSGGYWYNESIFESAGIASPPETWDGFYDMCQLLAGYALEQGAGSHAIMLRTDSSALYIFDNLLYMPQGMDVPDALAFMRRLADSGAVSFGQEGGTPYSYRDEARLFNSGTLAIFINGVWGEAMISPDVNARYALFPAGQGVAMSCETAALGYVLGKSGDERRMEAALDFLTYMLGEEAQTRLLMEAGQVPASPKADLDICKESMPRMHQAIRTVKDASIKIEIPDNLWNDAEKSRFEACLPPLLSGEADVAETERLLNLGNVRNSVKIQ